MGWGKIKEKTVCILDVLRERGVIIEEWGRVKSYEKT